MSGRRRRALSALGRVRPGTIHAIAGVVLLGGGEAVSAQAGVPTPAFLDSIPVRPFDFTPPRPDEFQVGGVTVLHLRDDALPLVDVHIHFRGGYAHLPRARYAPATALPALLSSGGSSDWPAAEVDRFMEGFAVQVSYGGSGGSVTSSMNVLQEHLDTAMAVWGSILREPAFDADRIAQWVDREREALRRREDNPAGFAFSEYNRLMYGDHPIGWEMAPEDLARDRVSPDAFADVHQRLLCRERMTMAVVSPIDFEDVRPRIEQFLDGWPACTTELPESPVPARVGVEPGIYLLPRELDQAVIVSTQVVELPQADTPDFFASRMGNVILGASGLSSRLNQELRTRLGLTYGASSVWTTPRRWPGLLGATTRVRTDGIVEALDALHRTVETMRTEPPSAAELAARMAEYDAGWAFNFRDPMDILARRIGFRAAELPDDWLTRYREGLRVVTPEDVRSIFERSVDPAGWVTLIVGDPDAIGAELDARGPVTVLGGG